MKRDQRPCPQCGEMMDFEPRHDAEPENNVPAWNGGWSCDCCDHSEEFELRDDD